MLKSHKSINCVVLKSRNLAWKCSKGLRTFTIKTRDLMIITLAQIYFLLYFVFTAWLLVPPLFDGCLVVWTSENTPPCKWIHSYFTGNHCRCSEMQGEMGSGKAKRGRKYFWRFSRRGNVSRTRPFSSFVVPDAQTQARWLAWSHLSTTGETMAMWKTAFTPNNVSRPTKSLNCWRLFCWLLFPKL